MNSTYGILVPLDGTPDGESVLGSAQPLLGAEPVRPTLLRAIPSNAPRKPAEEYLERLRASLAEQGIDSAVAIERGSPAHAILSWAQKPGFSLVAMAARPRSEMGRLAKEGVAGEVVRESPVPVLLTRVGTRMAGWLHVVVGLDGSARSERILEPAQAVARLLGATLHLVHVEEAPLPPDLRLRGDDMRSYLDRIAAGLRADGLRTEVALRDGRPARELLRYVEELHPGLIALATHGRSAPARLLLGSVVEELVRAASCPVLLARSATEIARGEEKHAWSSERV